MKLVEMPVECKGCGGKFSDRFKVKSKGRSLCISCYDKYYYHRVRAVKIKKKEKPQKPEVVLGEIKVKSNDFVEFMTRIIKRNYNISLNEMSDIITYWTELSGLPVWTYDSENDMPMKGGRQIYKMWKDLEKIYKYEYELNSI